MSVIGVQRRMMELGRVRLGEKGAKGEPKRLDTFRFTSASSTLLEAVAALYGGTVSEWEGAPDEGYYQITTDAKELQILLPPVFSAADGTPTTSYSQWYELWSGGGCQRRCDGLTEALSGQPCMCNPDDRQCQITTRISFMLPDIPGLGVWRLDSKGWNAAVELPGTLEVLMMAAAQNTFVPAVLRIEHRTKKDPGKGTRRFVVPVVDLPNVKIGELLEGATPFAVNAPQPAPERPSLPAAPVLPPEPVVADPDAKPDFGVPPPLDTGPVAPSGGGQDHQEGAPPSPPGDSDGASQLADRLVELARKLKAVKQTRLAIEANRQAHLDDPARHVEWLRTQLAAAEKAADA